MSALWFLVGLFMCAGFAVLPQEDSFRQDESPRFCPAYTVPVFGSARAQLDYARALKLRRHGASESMLEHWGLRAVDAYRVLPLRFPSERAVLQEALFRSGRLLVAMGRDDAALDDFFVAAEHSSEFGLRARMEVGHVHRRRMFWSYALDVYSSIANDADAQPGQRANARLLAGDMCLQMGMRQAAEQAWYAVVNGSSDRRKRVLAFDRMARMGLECPDFERLSEILLECLQNLDEVVLEESDEGQRVRRALARTQLVKALAKYKKKAL